MSVQTQYPEGRVANAELGTGTYRKYINSSSLIDSTNTYFSIQVIRDSVFTSLTDDDYDAAGGVMSGETVTTGQVLVGVFTGIKVSSGVAILHSYQVIA